MTTTTTAPQVGDHLVSGIVACRGRDHRAWLFLQRPGRSIALLVGALVAIVAGAVGVFTVIRGPGVRR